VYGPGRELIYDAPLSSVPRLLDSGLVRPVGPHGRIRSLLAVTGSEEFLRRARPAMGERYSHNHETEQNPRGVWTFRRLAYDAA
jgi:hypothetical protein